MKDLLIIGFGLGGLSIAKHAGDKKLTFDIISDYSQKSSKVAGGILNPIAVKRMKPVWNVEQFLGYADEYYKSLEKTLNTRLYFKKHIKVVIHNIEQENSWYAAYDKSRLRPFLFKDVIKNDSNTVEVNSFGIIKGALLNLERLFYTAKEFYSCNKNYISQSFDYSKLTLRDNHIQYNGQDYKHIIFCEGYGVCQNPYFNSLGIYGNKGDYLIIEAERLKQEDILKSKYFLIPLGNNLFKFGATYQRSPLNHAPSTEAKSQMLEALDKLVNVPYKIVDQVCGIRPTTKDRKPILGSHHTYKNFHILNGFGSRGVMTSPLLGNRLIAYVFEGKELDPETSIQRIYAQT